MEFCISLEKWDRDSLAALFSEGVLLLRHALVLQTGGDCGETDPDRRASACQRRPRPVSQGPALRRGRAGEAARFLRL